jgi:GTP-binding protein
MPQATFIKSASDPRGFPPDDCAEVAFVGRSNSGKSSAINAVAGVRGLARVSKTPGRTQLINFFAFGAERRLVDLPGYGFARVAPAVRERWRTLLEAYFAGRGGLRGVVITIDARRGVMPLDATMIEWADALDLPMLWLLTKADKLNRSAVLAAQRAAAEVATGRVAQIVPFSATTGLGVESARTAVEAWYAGPPLRDGSRGRRR